MTILGAALIATFSLSFVAIAKQFLRQFRAGQREPTSTLLAFVVLISIVLLLIQFALPRLQIAMHWIQVRVEGFQIP